jgi:acetate kinase
MSQAIIVLNAGSSSLKFSIYAVAEPKLDVVARGQIEGLGTSPHFKAKDQHGEVLADTALKSDSKKFGHPEAFAHLARWTRDQYADKYAAVGVGHRIVHGVARFTVPTVINDEVLAEIEKLVPLMPLHLPPNLAAVRAVMQLRPDLPQVACFDTSFHQGREKVMQRFGLPDDLFEKGLRRWGFHGLSYEFIASQIAKVAPALADGRVIVAHLGSGASLCAMRRGRSVDTTMSFSALDGLPMGTRCGKLDPGVLLFLLQRGMTAQQIEELLYKKSGLLGISGISNDGETCSRATSPWRRRPSISSSIASCVRSARSPPRSVGSTG